MRAIEFTDSELLEILSFYREERDNILKKIAEIESILSLSQPAETTPETDVLPSPSTNRRSARKMNPASAASTDEATAEPTTPETGNGSTGATERKKRKTVAKPRGRLEEVIAEGESGENEVEVPSNLTHLNGKWVRFIADLLEKQGRVIAADDIVSEAIYHYDIADEKHQTTRQVIYNTLYKLDSSKRMIGSCTIPGRKGKRYGLKKWFTPDGEIKESFLVKAT